MMAMRSEDFGLATSYPCAHCSRQECKCSQPDVVLQGGAVLHAEARAEARAERHLPAQVQGCAKGVGAGGPQVRPCAHGILQLTPGTPD